MMKTRRSWWTLLAVLMGGFLPVDGGLEPVDDRSSPAGRGSGARGARARRLDRPPPPSAARQRPAPCSDAARDRRLVDGRDHAGRPRGRGWRDRGSPAAARTGSDQLLRGPPTFTGRVVGQPCGRPSSWARMASQIRASSCTSSELRASNTKRRTASTWPGAAATTRPHPASVSTARVARASSGL